jgi:hypothetical protein
MPPIHPLLRSVLRAPAGFPPLDASRLAAILCAAAAAGWFAAGMSMHTRALAAGEALPMPAAVAGLVMLAGRVTGWIAEALAHALVWGALGRRLAVTAFLAWLPAISTCDLIAHMWPSDGDGLLGPAPAAARAQAGSGFDAAFGAFGLLAMLRLVLTADVQRRVLGGGWAAPLAVTGSLWLASRLTVWWGLDLVRGGSPL